MALPTRITTDDITGTYEVRLHSDGEQYPLIRIDSPFNPSATAYVYEDSGEQTVSIQDASLVKTA